MKTPSSNIPFLPHQSNYHHKLKLSQQESLRKNKTLNTPFHPSPFKNPSSRKDHLFLVRTTQDPKCTSTSSLSTHVSHLPRNAFSRKKKKPLHRFYPMLEIIVN